MEFRPQVERFASARRCLMLPHPDGDAAAISKCFVACHAGLRSLRRGLLDAHAQQWLEQLEQLMSTETIEANSDSERLQKRAQQLSAEEQSDLSRLVDELANWFAAHVESSR